MSNALNLRFNDVFKDHRGIYYYYVSPVTQIDIQKFGWDPYTIEANTHIFVEISQKEFVYLTEEEILHYLEYIS